ncbi:hypothetical protein [Psychromonas sp. MME2]|uniref:hypothetical protein n=2 Tax=unclassified Psychromonas TaxID=2614957 RepID=UPI00339BB6ED
MQNDTTWYDGDYLDFLGEDKKVYNTTTIEPVMPFQLTENIKYIFRPVIPIHSWETPQLRQGATQYPGGELPVSVDFERKTEMGDIVLWNALGSNDMVKPPNIMGFGITAMLDTATNKAFGTGKNSVGPMAVLLHVGAPKEYMYGAVVQHWWSISGVQDRDDVNMTNIQYIAFYRYNDSTNFGFGSPNITANWEADNGDVWTIPVGFGFNTMTKIGPMPVRIGIEAYKYIEKPDNFGAEYGLRFYFSPVVPSPDFSKHALF